jgi:hypothetical protein
MQHRGGRATRVTTRGTLLVLLCASLAPGCGGRSVTTNQGGPPAGGDGPRADARPRADAAAPPLADARPPGPDIPLQANCDPSGAMCYLAPGPCPPGEVLSVVNACWGPCVDHRLCAPVDCDAAKVACRAMSPDCAQPGSAHGLVPMVKDQCWGPCVPIEICRCDPGGPRTQCPLDSYVCYSFSRTCGPLE